MPVGISSFRGEVLASSYTVADELKTSLNFGVWRLNVRASNTEPLLRLNIESRADKNPRPMQDYVDELTQLIQS